MNQLCLIYSEKLFNDQTDFSNQKYNDTRYYYRGSYENINIVRHILSAFFCYWAGKNGMNHTGPTIYVDILIQFHIRQLAFNTEID